VNFRCLWKENNSLTRAYLWARITKDLLHGLQVALRSVRDKSPEPGTSDNTRYFINVFSCYSLTSRPIGVRRRVAHPTPRMAISGSSWNSASYSRSDHVPAVPRIWQFLSHRFFTQLLYRLPIDGHLRILGTLRDVDSFLEVFPSNFLPRPIAKSSTVIVNADSCSEGVSHSLALHFGHKSPSAYYFDFYGIVKLVADILAFIRRNCTTWDQNGRKLQGLRATSASRTAVCSPSTWIGVHS